MRQSDVISLISVQTRHDANGIPVVTETKHEVFATVKSVTRAEFWEAQRSGVELLIAFEVRKEDYQKERVIEYNGEKYRIEHIRQKSVDWLELNCSDKAV